MKKPADSPLDGVALSIAVVAIMLRWLMSGETSGTGLNLFINLLFWLALGVWFVGRSIRGGLTWRFTGFEFPLLALAIIGFISALGASHALPALELAFTWLSYGLVFVLVTQVLPRSVTFGMLYATLGTLAVYALIQNLIILPGLVDQVESIGVKRRAASGEVFATFLYPNAYAGYLVLLIPVLLGSLLDARDQDRRTLGIKAGGLLLCLLAIALTGSLGGWIALATGLACMGALAATRTRGRKALVIAGLAFAVIGIGVTFFGPLLDWMAERSQTMANRKTYWHSAAGIFKEAPILGVGPGNFQDYYYEFKPDDQQEVNKVHNDYLQVLVETGLLGLLAFLTLLGWGLRRALATDTPDPPPDSPVAGWLVPVMGGAAFLLAFVLDGVLADLPMLVFVVGGTWVAIFIFSRKGEEALAGGPMVFTRLGLAAGLVSIMVHMMVDFDFYDAGVSMTLFMALGFIAVLKSPRVEVAFPPPACIIGAVAVFVVALPFLTIVFPKALEADTRLEVARNLISKKKISTKRSKKR